MTLWDPIVTVSRKPRERVACPLSARHDALLCARLGHTTRKTTRSRRQ